MVNSSFDHDGPQINPSKSKFGRSITHATVVMTNHLNTHKVCILRLELFVDDVDRTTMTQIVAVGAREKKRFW